MNTVYLIYGITDCPACLRACADLMEHYPQKEYVFIETDFSQTYRQYLLNQYGWPTFPIVVKLSEENSESLIGGQQELEEHLQNEQPSSVTRTPESSCIIKSSQ